MIAINKNNKCRRIRSRLLETVSKCFNPNAEWLQNHIANCPRCRRRFISYAKVNLAMSAIKSQPHELDLLMCANTQAISVLKHSLRKAPKARKLEKALPEPKLKEKCSGYTHSLANVAACITILFLTKIGLFSSPDMCQATGRKVMKQYYANHVGQELADEIFPQDDDTGPVVTS